MESDKSRSRIKKNFIKSIFATFVFIFFITILSIYWLQNLHIKNNIIKIENEVLNSFKGHIDEEAFFLESQIHNVKNDISLQTAWLNKDKKALFDRAQSFYSNLKKKYEITHFYFIDLNKICFLRVHKYERDGDAINRFTMKQAVESAEMRYGVELGPLGTLTLRVVHPWLINGVLKGYIEMGMEIEHCLDILKKNHGIETAILISKQFLKKQEWESGMKMLGRDFNWDENENYVVIKHTFKNQDKSVFFNSIRDQLVQNPEKMHDKMLTVDTYSNVYKGQIKLYNSADACFFLQSANLSWISL